jgi:hypothetical protein
MIGLAVFSVMSLRSAFQTRRATEASMESMRRHEAFRQIMSVCLRFSGFLMERKRLPRTLEELDP